MSGFGLVDDVIKEPLGGAHSYPEKTADAVKKYIENALKELKNIDVEDRIQQRIDKFSSMGFYTELKEA
jgi:acetyl-CoA carboxylase carboxyl transferase subunit alpha